MKFALVGATAGCPGMLFRKLLVSGSGRYRPALAV